MKRVLFMDDQQERHTAFCEDLEALFDRGEVALWRADSAGEAVWKIQNENAPFDVVFLDHDLGTGCHTGQAVADYVAGMSEEARPRAAVLHSWNPAGAEAMERTLRAAGVRTFVWPFKAVGAAVALRHVLREIEKGGQ